MTLQATENSPPPRTRSRADLTAEERRIVADYWWSRSEGELTSWVGFGHVLEDLRAEGSPSAVLELAERAVRDEHKHSMFCREWAIRFGHPGDGEVRPRSEEPLRFRGATDAENRLLRILMCCFTETVGCFILRHVRQVVNDPDLRLLNQRHLADELQHSRVGWGHLATLRAEQRERLRAWAPAVLSVLPEACCEGAELDREELVPFGYFTPRLLRAAHDEALAEVILPGLVHLGLREAA
jgi:hypothetical protein